MNKKLTLGNDKLITGVCSGLAEYFDIDVVLIRVLYLVLTFTPWFPGILLYLCLWIIMPKKTY